MHKLDPFRSGPTKSVYVRARRDDSAVKVFDVSDWSESEIEKLVAGLLINMSPDYYVDESEVA
jgi:hypothetical protein